MENFGNSHLKELISILKTNCAKITDEDCGRLNCHECRATAIYEAGWRKQIEAEWIKTETNSYCSECKENVISWSGEYDGYERQRRISLMKFCPNCGAKMKGAE